MFLLSSFSKLRKIKIHHARILLALRLFLLCQYVLDRSRMRHSSSQRLLIGAPIEADIDDNLKSASALLIERVPLPFEYYDQSQEPFGLTLFKAGSNVLNASSAFAHYLVGQNRFLYKYFGPILLIMAIPYYAIRHQKAARYTTRMLIDHPNVDIIRRGWGVFGNSKLACTLALLRAPKLAIRQLIYVNEQGTKAGESKKEKTDIPVYLYSPRPISSIKLGTWDNATTNLTNSLRLVGLPHSKNVLFYVHGGGFFTSFLAKDLYNLSEWAMSLGVLIVYVGKL